MIKNHSVGNGKPLICVPVTEQSGYAILAAAREIAKKGADMLEWRMDFYENILSWKETRQLLAEISEICKDMILLCTFRSKQQGGEKEIAKEDYENFLYQIAGSGYADVLDVEVRELFDAGDTISRIHSDSTYVIASQHYFSHTPETEAMEEELSDMKKAGADIAKLAVMPKKNTDVLRLLEATAKMKEKYPSYPLVTMAMGGMGMISRISGQIFGSCVTFATVGKASAPGQLPIEDVSRMIERISESMEE